MKEKEGKNGRLQLVFPHSGELESFFFAFVDAVFLYLYVHSYMHTVVHYCCAGPATIATICLACPGGGLGAPHDSLSARFSARPLCVAGRGHNFFFSFLYVPFGWRAAPD
jgi:hypothetical protein